MKCPSCGKSVSLNRLRESFARPHCGVQLKGRTNLAMLVTMCCGPAPRLLAEVLYFGFRSPLVSVLLLGLSHWLVWTVVLKGALQKDEANQQPWPPVFGRDRPFTHAAQFADTLGSATSPPGNNQATPACS